MTIDKLVKEVHENAKKHGWWDEKRTVGDIIALCHCELSEAMEEHRNGHKPNEIYYSGSGRTSREPEAYCNKPEGIPIELADVVIRIMDFCGREGIDLEAAIKMKHAYNITRPYKHGGKIV